MQNISKNIETRSEAASEITSLTGVLLFVTSFLGITFLIAAVLYILNKLMKLRMNLKIILFLKLGFTHQDMSKDLS